MDWLVQKVAEKNTPEITNVIPASFEPIIIKDDSSETVTRSELEFAFICYEYKRVSRKLFFMEVALAVILTVTLVVILRKFNLI